LFSWQVLHPLYRYVRHTGWRGSRSSVAGAPALRRQWVGPGPWSIDS
jgi:hypothetical protein